MKQLCLNQTPCPSDSPFGNFSSEKPDAVGYVTLTGPPPSFSNPPIGGNTWVTRYCLGICKSEVSQVDADQCAARNAIDCLVHPPNDNNGGGGGGWTRPEYPPPGKPVPPGQQPPGHGNPIKLFESKAADCTQFCPDGSPALGHVEAGAFTYVTQAGADAMAHGEACRLAYYNRICFGTIELYACLSKKYSSSLTVTGFNPPYNFTVTKGNLPPGLKIENSSMNTCLISGTCLTADIFEFEITATDSTGNSNFHSFEIDVLGLANNTDTDYPDAQVGVDYAWQFEAAGGVEPITFKLGGGYLNINGIELDADGFFHGTPNAPGVKSFTIEVTDGTGRKCSIDLELDIMAELRTQTGCAGAFDSIIFDGFVGQIPPLTFSPQSGTVPAGMELVQLDNHTASLEGIPFPAGTYDFSLRITDSLNNRVDQPFRYNCLGIVNAEDWLITPAVVNVAYNYQFQALGGDPPDGTYTYSKISGAFPTGITLNASGLISGTPTVEGTFTIIVRVTDQHGHFCNQEIHFVVYPTPPVNFANMQITSTTAVADGGPVCGFQTHADAGKFGACTWDASAFACPPAFNVINHAYAIITGSIDYVGPADTVCQIILDHNQVHGSSTIILEVRNKANGLIYSFSQDASGSTSVGSDKFSWGSTGGGIRVMLRADAYGQHVPPIVIPSIVQAESLIIASFYPCY